MLYLKNKLLNDGYNTGLIFGGIDISERNKIIDDFKNDKFQILLSSEVGSTGLDMQFCNRIVNYDLPWNPMVIEQRIGRIDRIGQQSEIINIFNFIYKNTIEEQIYHRLYDRIGLFKESLGNLDEILGETEMYIDGEIGKIYKQNLSKSDIEKRLDQIAYAIERNKLDLNRIDEGLKDSFSNDLYFENEIKAIEKNKQYLTEFDLVEFIDRIIANKLTTFTFVRSNENSIIYNISQPQDDLLFDFIEEYYDSNNSELANIFKSFKTRNRGKLIKCTFNQEFAFVNKNIEYISAYHPLINAISNFFYKSKLDRNTTFKFSINRNNIVEQEFLEIFPNQCYFLIKYELEVSKIINGKISTFLYLKSLVLDLSGDTFSTFNYEQSDYFSSICQQFKTSLPEVGNIEFTEELMQEIKKIYTEFVLKSKDTLEENEKLKFESELTRKTTQEITDVNKRIERLEKNIIEKRGIENILKAEISELEKRKNKLQLSYNESKISVKSRLISLNYIYIYG